MMEVTEEPTTAQKRTLKSKEQPERKRVKRELSFTYTNEEMDKSVRYVAGIDEAGRGPVLGPMVYSIAFYPMQDHEKKLRAIGFNDSKQLSEVQRDDLFEKIHQHNVGFIVDPISAETLSKRMLRIDRRNLNEISFDSAIDIVQRVISMGFLLDSLYVDTVGSPEAYQKLLTNRFPGISSIIVSKKADGKFPIVGAASICAKVIRDRLLRDWGFKENVKLSYSFGSGYPGDQNTKEWLSKAQEHVFGFPSLVRFCWSTTTNCLKDSAAVHWSFEDLKAHEEITQHSRMAAERRRGLEDADKRYQIRQKGLKKLQTRSNYFASTGMSRCVSSF